MGIEQRMEFDFSYGEKVAELSKYGLTASKDNLDNLTKENDVWMIKGKPVEEYAKEIADLYDDRGSNEYWKK